MSDADSNGLTYSQAGVDIERAGAVKQRIKSLARSTFNSQVLTEIGSFGGVFRPDLGGLESPVLISSADGVGTKLKIAFMTGIHNTVGLDLVAHCTNDILVCGAKPLFFLDYLAAGELQPRVVEELVTGVAAGCREAGCALLGGETAEMPDFYDPGEYDLAGFIVGLAEESRMYDPSQVRVGDRLLGLPSSGLHTNGYSLARKLFFEQEQLSVDTHVDELGRTLGEELLEPHRGYLNWIRRPMQQGRLRAIAHITGGGIPGNLDRVLPSGVDAFVETDSWEAPPIFKLIESMGRVSQREMFRTFNMGVGMILVVAPSEVDVVLESLRSESLSVFEMGEIRQGEGKVVLQ